MAKKKKRTAAKRKAAASNPPKVEYVSPASRRRQSLLDRHEMKFAYSKATGIYHDRDCPWVKSIADENFEMYQEYNKAGKWCERCYRNALIRSALVPDEMKYFSAYCKRFNRLWASNADLYRLFIVEKAVLYRIDTELVYLKVHDDKWAIGMDEDGIYIMHNNYVRAINGDRIMRKEFHHDGTITLGDAIRLMTSYNYDLYHREDVMLFF